MIDTAHLLEQAERLVAEPNPGEQPCLTDRRRAVSAIYYAVFHAGLTAAADQAVGAAHRATELYSLAYRSVEHKKMKSLCAMVQQPQPPNNYRRYAPAGGWGAEIIGFGETFVTLNEQRMLADYDPVYSISVSEVRNYISTARAALALLDAAPEPAKTAFLTLLLFPPR